MISNGEVSWSASKVGGMVIKIWWSSFRCSYCFTWRARPTDRQPPGLLINNTNIVCRSVELTLEFITKSGAVPWVHAVPTALFARALCAMGSARANYDPGSGKRRYVRELWLQRLAPRRLRLEPCNNRFSRTNIFVGFQNWWICWAASLFWCMVIAHAGSGRIHFYSSFFYYYTPYYYWT